MDIEDSLLEIDESLTPKVSKAIEIVIDYLEEHGVDQSGPQHHAEFELLYALVRLHDRNWYEAVKVWDFAREAVEERQQKYR